MVGSPPNTWRRGFGFLSWADNNRYITDPAQKALIQLAPQMQAVSPNPTLKCPDVAKSQAQTAVDTFHPNWDYEVVSNYFLNGGDIKQIRRILTQQMCLPEGAGR